LSGLLLTAGIAVATELPATPDRFEVELIVFRHIDQSRNTPEIPAASSIFQASPLDLILAVIPTRPPQGPTTPLGMSDNTPARLAHKPPITFQLVELDPDYPDFVPLKNDARTLDKVYDRLKRISAYEPIAHVGWVQPARDTDHSKPYRFEPKTTGNTDITGTVTLYMGRFLHFEVDLTLEAEKTPVEQHFLLDTSVDESPDLYKLSESRRIRGTAAHYFDTPQFGVIARIQEVHTAQAERAESG